MALIDQLQKDIIIAMRAKDEARLSAIRMVKAALMKEKAVLNSKYSTKPKRLKKKRKKHR